MRRLLTALPALALLAGCGMLFAEFEIPSTTITLLSQTFPGVSGVPPLPGQTVTMTRDLTFNIGKDISIITEKGVTFELRLTRLDIELIATPAMGDFGKIKSVELTVLHPPGSTLPDVVIASYTRVLPNPTTIGVAARSDLDLAPYILSGDLLLRITAESDVGNIPDWTADVAAEFYLKVHADYLKAL